MVILGKKNPKKPKKQGKELLSLSAFIVIVEKDVKDYL